jgi:hypothetical protein
MRNSLAENQLSRRQRVVLVSCGLIVVFSVTSLWYLDFYYYAYGSRMPLPAEGRIYLEWVHHGTEVYLTQQEYLPFKILPTLCGILTLLAAVLLIRWKR